jgi:predicted kinase
MRYLFVLRGAPASGKSTWIKENELEPYTISTDSLRLMYQSPVTTAEGDRKISQNNDKEVWNLLMELLERRMENGELVVIDATHYKSSLINRYKDLVSKYRYRVYVVDFSNVPEDEQEYLRFFAFICSLSFDVYVKKMIIEKLIDQLPEPKNDKKKKK